MPNPKAHDQSRVSYGQPEGHRDHLCLLMEKGMVAEIVERTRRPVFFCANCGAKADQCEDLCRSRPLGNK